MRGPDLNGGSATEDRCWQKKKAKRIRREDKERIEFREEMKLSKKE